jgi:hypothetical protein
MVLYSLSHTSSPLSGFVKKSRLQLGAGQEDHSLQPVCAKSSREPISKKIPSQKRAGGVAQGVGLSLHPSPKKKKKKEERNQGFK